MARLPRYFAEGYPQHIILRGNNRELMFAHEQDYLFYLECLQQASEYHELAIHAYVLMTNHVHLLGTPSTESSIPKTLLAKSLSWTSVAAGMGTIRGTEVIIDDLAGSDLRLLIG